MGNRHRAFEEMAPLVTRPNPKSKNSNTHSTLSGSFWEPFFCAHYI